MGEIPKPIAVVQETQAVAPAKGSLEWNFLADIRRKQGADPTAMPTPTPDAAAGVAPPNPARAGAPAVPTMRDIAIQDATDLAYRTNSKAEIAAKVVPLVGMAGAGILSSRHYLPAPVKRFFESKTSFGNRFGSLALGEGGGAVVDGLTEDNLNHRFTNLNDLVVDPLIATRMRGNFALKGGLMVGSHILGRVIDYFIHEDPAGALKDAAAHRPKNSLDLLNEFTGTPPKGLPVESPTVVDPHHAVEYNPLAGATVTPEDRHNQEVNRARQLGVRPEDLPFVNGGRTESYKAAPVKGATEDPNVAPPAVKVKPLGSLDF